MSHPRLDVVDRLLAIVEHEILPLTRAGVAEGNKVFGAAVVDRTSLETVVAATNEETGNPLLHGEISTLNAYWARPADARPRPENCLFLSTHEPCSLCLSAITWSGFDNFFYLFTYEDSRDAFAIPHDLRILDEVFGLTDGEYRRSNAYWTAYSLQDLVAARTDAGEAAARDRIRRLAAAYAELSAAYQTGKDATDIPLR